ncbi:hypothetical protein O181_006538 [Austropuccinia psidii MF-1]|uniref:Histone-lysine N-methyltransferase SETMAR n=1 Tax=Austropuccinia psidii MF-1 TaxID=1389203 RepID=A0A9Q3GGP0_9BASI|nr:hypothetical protein [Austropuccinia psidii MF-1]
MKDLTDGREPQPVPLESDCDLSQLRLFQEYTAIMLERRSRMPASSSQFEEGLGCDCASESYCDKDCFCVETHGYFYDSERLLQLDALPPMHALFECSAVCQCSAKCRNRNVQAGIQLELVVRPSKMPSLGLGLFSLVDIPKGRFVCLYAGELIDQSEAHRRWASRKSLQLSNYILVVNESNRTKRWKTIIDPTYYGNVGRFINHACPPLASLVMLPVRPCGQVTPLPALFARRDILKGEELSFDYYDASGSSPSSIGVTDPAFDESIMTRCLCGSPCCRKYMPFDSTL